MTIKFNPLDLNNTFSLCKILSIFSPYCITIDAHFVMIPSQKMKLLCRKLHIDRPISRAKVRRHGLLRLAHLPQRDGLVAVETVEEANLDDPGNLEQLLREPAHLPLARVLAVTFLRGAEVLGEQQGREGGVDDPHAVVRHALAGLAGQAGADGGFWRAHGLQAGEDVGRGQGEDLDGDGEPLGAQAGGLLAVVFTVEVELAQNSFCVREREIEHTGHGDELLGRDGDELLLEETGASALDQVQVLVDLVGAIKGHVQGHALAVHDGALVEVGEIQAGGADETLGLATGGDKGHGPVELGALGDDGIDDVDDGAARADADEAVLGEEMLVDSLEGSGLLGGLYQGGGGRHGAG